MHKEAKGINFLEPEVLDVSLGLAEAFPEKKLTKKDRLNYMLLRIYLSLRLLKQNTTW